MISRSLGLTALAGAAALTLALSTVMSAHQPQQAQQDTAPLTEAQTAGVKRLKEVIEVLNSGDYATIRAYFEAQGEEKWLGNALSRHRRSHGYDLMRVTTDPDRDDMVVGIVRNRITGDEEYLAFRMDPQAPHRITLFSAAVRPEVVASWNLTRVSHTSGLERGPPPLDNPDWLDPQTTV